MVQLLIRKWHKMHIKCKLSGLKNSLWGVNNKRTAYCNEILKQMV